MKNYVQEGVILSATAPANATSGTPVKIGAAFGVYVKEAKTGEECPLITEGVVELPKDNSNISKFAVVYWDDTAKKITTTVGSNTKVGYATDAAGTSAVTVTVKLVPTL